MCALDPILAVFGRDGPGGEIDGKCPRADDVDSAPIDVQYVLPVGRIDGEPLIMPYAKAWGRIGGVPLQHRFFYQCVRASKFDAQCSVMSRFRVSKI
jgi:hypothetical protein